MWGSSNFRNIIIVLCLAHTTLQTEQQDKNNNDEKKDQIPGVGLSIVFIFGGLLLGGFIKAFSEKIKIPYNPILLFLGMLLGIYHESLGFIGQSTKLISQINPNGLLAIFLPALIFQSAFKTQWHMFKKQIQQTFILGVLCVFLSTTFIVLGLFLLLGYSQQYSLPQACLLGFILCCTDIFSFVSKLKQYGTPQKVISLIEGESLVNYCTCFLMFQIINQIFLTTQTINWIQIVSLLLSQTIGSFLVGATFGLLGLFWIKRISNDGQLVVTTMIILCYSVYVINQFSLLKVSGIISLVTFTVYIGVWGKAHMIGQAQQFMKSFWDYAVFVAQTSIFLISGVFVGINVFFLEQITTYEQILKTFYLYLIVLFSRYFSILIFQKTLSKLGYGMQWKQSIIIAFSGLKGAIGISLAMIVFQGNGSTVLVKNLVLLHVTGNSILTLLINGTATPLALRFLKISKLTKVQYKLFGQFLEGYKQKIEEKKNLLRGQRFLNIVDWEQIKIKTGMQDVQKLQKEVKATLIEQKFQTSHKFQKRQLYILEKALKDFANSKQNADHIADDQYQKQTTNFHILVQIRKRFIKKLRFRYWIYHQQRHASVDAVISLIRSANFDLDTETEQLQSWSWIKSEFTQTIKIFSQLRKLPVVGSVARNYLFNYIFYCYDVVMSYIQANEQVRQQFLQANFKDFNEDAVNLILNESQQNMKQAEDFMKNYLKPSFPQIQTEVQTRKSSFLLLSDFQNQTKRLFKTGQLQNSEYQQLINLIDQKKVNLQLQSPEWQVQKLKNILKADDVFGLLPDKILQIFQDNLTIFETHDANQVIQNHLNIGKYIYIIRRGGCSAQFSSNNLIFKQSLVVGDIYGYQCLISKSYRSKITSKTLLVAIGIKKNYIIKLMDFFPEFEQALWKKYILNLLKMFSNNNDVSYFLAKADTRTLQKMVKQFKLLRLQPGIHQIKEDMIFFRGTAKYSSGFPEQQQIHKIKTDNFDQIIQQSRFIEPLTIIEPSQINEIEVTEKSSFLVGKLQMRIMDSQRLTNNSAYKKKYSSYYEEHSSPKKLITRIEN